MRLTAIILLSATLHVCATGRAQNISISSRPTSLENVFKQIEEQTGYSFLWNENLLDKTRMVSIGVKNATLQQVLSLALKDLPVTYKINDKVVFIVAAPRPPVAALPDTAKPAQPTVTVHGWVMSESGSGVMAGTSVTIKETNRSTLTSNKGEFTITGVPLGGKLIFSYVGYTSVEKKITMETLDIYVVMKMAVSNLDAEVVQAYGKTSQRLAVGNIFKVSAADIEKQPVMNPLLALNGRVPGMVVTPTSGYASAPVKVEIRGRNTLGSNLVSDPLYVIDGVPLSVQDVDGQIMGNSYQTGSTGFNQGGISNVKGQSPLFSMNPATIESISVLKDADATAIYGSRGANGVILINTKRGRAGRTEMQIRVDQSVSTVPKHWNMLNTPQYVEMRREALKNDGLAITKANAPDLLVWDTTRYTDWQKVIWGNAKNTTANFSLSGGDAQTNFIMGASYTDAKDLTTISGGNKRVTLNFNATHRSQDQKFRMDFSTNYGYTNVQAITAPSVTGLPPNAPPIFDKKGNLNYAEWNNAGMNANANPFNVLLVPSIGKSQFLTGSIQLSYNLTKGLNLGARGGYNYVHNNSTLQTTIASQNPITNPTGTVVLGTTDVSNWNIDPQVTYVHYFGKGKLDILVGGTFQYSNTGATTTAGLGYTSDALLNSIGNAQFVKPFESAAQKKYADLHGRINYNWENKYIIQLSGNRDGSSNFGSDRLFGNFWSTGFAWIASEEDWMKKLLPSFWSFLKISATYGVTGIDLGSSYQYLSQWGVPQNGGANYPNYNGISPMSPVHAVNQDYQWQENRKLNLDLTMSFLKDRINLVLSYYRDRCNNQLTNLPTPIFTGFGTVVGNSPANLQNSGFEGSLTARVIEQKDFSWTATFNFSLNRNKLLSFPDFAASPYYTQYKIGKSINTVYLLHYTGINPMNGQRSYTDYNHDGYVKTSNSVPSGTGNDDRYIAIDPSPKFDGGFSSTFYYKQFTLGIYFVYMKKMSPVYFSTTPGALGNIPVDAFNGRWVKPGDQVRNVRFSNTGAASDNYFGQSDGGYTDGSYIQLSNLYIMWNLSGKYCKKAGLHGAALTLAAQNLFNITSYKGLDPVTSFGSMPMPRIINGGISLTF